MSTKLSVLYTHQKTKKRKTWQDGTLTVAKNGKTADLRNEDMAIIATVYIKKKLSPGDDLECSKYLIQVDEVYTAASSPLPTQESQNHSQATPTSMSPVLHAEPPVTNKTPVFSQPARKRQKFSVPRQLTCSQDVTSRRAFRPPRFARNNGRQAEEPAEDNTEVDCEETADGGIWSTVECKVVVEGKRPVNSSTKTVPIRTTKDILEILNEAKKKHVVEHPDSDAMLHDPGLALANNCSPVSGKKCGEKENKQQRAIEDASVLQQQNFKCPVLKRTLQDRLKKELFFPTTKDLKENSTPSRTCEIKTTYSSVEDYVNTLVSVQTEYLNLTLWQASENYHLKLMSADLTKYASTCKWEYDSPSSSVPAISQSEKENSVSLPPSCHHNIEVKCLTVKNGHNKGRRFYKCSLPASKSCKFFKWKDEREPFSPSEWSNASGKEKLNNNRAVMSYMKRNGIDCYCECTFIRQIPDAFVPGTKVKVPAWIRKARMENIKKRLLIKLPRKEHYSAYNIDDIWVISHSLNFEKDETFIARSTFFTPNSDAEVEIQPLSGYFSSKWENGDKVYALHIFNAQSELTCIRNLKENLTKDNFPLLPHILDMKKSNHPVGQKLINTFHQNHIPVVKPITLEHSLEFDYSTALELANKFIEKYGLNEDQSSVICLLVDVLSTNGKDMSPIMLLHGVFGSGKSFLLSVLIIFMSELAKLSSKASGWKILLSSTTNVAVDRVLLSLLDLGFTSFCRVGPLQKINDRVLPHSIHITDAEHVKELRKMLSNPDLTPDQKRYIKRSLEQARFGTTRTLLSKALVVGVTCAASSAKCLKSFTFPLVILDECTQCTEPNSLLPLGNFGCRGLILCGDPNQLPPTIEGSKSVHKRGLEQTLFTRLKNMGHTPVMLRTQYRCHPSISGLAGKLFYSDQVKDGITAVERPRLVNKLPNLMFYDISDGKEERDSSNSYTNEREANFISQLVKLLLSHGIPGTGIGIIVVYKSQVQEVKSALQNIELLDLSDVSTIKVSTIDAFQGAEKNVIIFSCVRSTSSQFADCNERMCVGLTRARNHLLIVGNRKCLSHSPKWKQVITSCGSCIQTPFQFRQIWGKKLEQASNQEGCIAQPPQVQQFNHAMKFRLPITSPGDLSDYADVNAESSDKNEPAISESPLFDLDDEDLRSHDSEP